MDYSSLHWGTGPTEEMELTCPKGSARIVGELKACSYATVKAGKPDVYRHAFKRFNDDSGNKRGPYLLKLSKNGEYTLNGCIDDTIAVGRVVDFEMIDGEVYVLHVGCFLVTDKDGNHLWLVGPRVPYDIEKREDGPIVTVRGIEA